MQEIVGVAKQLIFIFIVPYFSFWSSGLGDDDYFDSDEENIEAIEEGPGAGMGLGDDDYFDSDEENIEAIEEGPGAGIGMPAWSAGRSSSSATAAVAADASAVPVANKPMLQQQPPYPFGSPTPAPPSTPGPPPGVESPAQAGPPPPLPSSPFSMAVFHQPTPPPQQPPHPFGMAQAQPHSTMASPARGHQMTSWQQQQQQQQAGGDPIRGSGTAGRGTSNSGSCFANQASQTSTLGRDDFEIGPKLGSGQYGHVFIAREKRTQHLVALKEMSKARIAAGHDEALVCREIEIQSQLRHPHILRLYGYFYDEKNIYLIMEYAPGGELFQKLEAPGSFLPEKEVAHLIQQLVSAAVLPRKERHAPGPQTREHSTWSKRRSFAG